MSAPPRFAGGLDTTGRPNILLVLIEGISGAYLPTVAASQGLSLPEVAHMPRLDALAREHVVYTNFIHQQRQTNRGEYAIVCGDYPKLDDSLAKMSEFSRSDRVCVPRILKEGGYQTFYMQSAPLAFMFKDQFMKKAGFEGLKGPEAFGTGHFRNGWGVDDLTLYEESLKVLEGASKKGKPWFATLMTVTTHHPYATPDDFKPLSPTSTPHQLGLEYADMALGALMKGLEAKGMLKDTVVIVSSDESAGLMYGRVPNQTLRTMANNWGFAVVVAPLATRATVSEPYQLSDMGLSIVDLAGLGAAAPHLVGRSMFREYGKGRMLHFANTYSNRQGMYTPQGTLILCEIETLQGCRAFEHEKDRLFALKEAAAQPSKHDVDLMSQALRMSKGATGDASALTLPFEGSSPLLELKELTLPPGAEHQLIFGGQFLTLPPKTLVKLDLEVAVEADGTVDFKHMALAAGQQLPIMELPILSGGDTFHVQTEFYFEQGTHGFRYHFAGRQLTAKSATLHIKTATITLSLSPPRPSWRQTLGQVTRAPDADPQVYSLEHSLHFKFRPTCSGRNERTGVFSVYSCESPHLLFGPFVPAQKGAKVRFEVTATATSQPSELHVDIVSAGGEVVHAQSEPARLEVGESVRFFVEAELKEEVSRLEARVVRTQGVRASSVRGLKVSVARLTVSSPPPTPVP